MCASVDFAASASVYGEITNALFNQANYGAHTLARLKHHLWHIHTHTYTHTHTHTRAHTHRPAGDTGRATGVFKCATHSYILFKKHTHTHTHTAGPLYVMRTGSKNTQVHRINDS